MRTLAKLGHEVRLIAPAQVKPHVKRGRKNDAAAAAAIAEAVTRPHMQFVPVKSEAVQAVLMLHRTRRLPITKAGDRYLRSLMVVGATGTLWRRRKEQGTWLAGMMARIAWAILAKGG